MGRRRVIRLTVIRMTPILQGRAPARQRAPLSAAAAAYSRSRRRGGLAHDELHRERLPRHLLARHHRGERLERGRAQPLGVGADRRQRRRRGRARTAGRRSRRPTGPPGSAAPRCAGRQVHAAGEDVVVADDRGRRIGGVEQLARRPRGVVEVEPGAGPQVRGGSTPTDSSAARQRALRIWNVGYCTREPSWPIRRCPSSIRCASAASVPPAVSSETHGSPRARPRSRRSARRPGAAPAARRRSR